ncbi:hypothetical protein MXB_3177, partial [Myxobolus squamalis]
TSKKDIGKISSKRSETVIGTLCRFIGECIPETENNGAIFLHGLSIVQISDIRKFRHEIGQVKYQEIVFEPYLMRKSEPPALQRLYRLISPFNLTSLPFPIYLHWNAVNCLNLFPQNTLVNMIKNKSCKIMALKRENLPDTPI